jgi:radical SAM protein with 4Fe4S-binding SPASM domain
MITNREHITKENLNSELSHIAKKLEVASIEDLTFPRFILLETTTVCNARCPFCTYDDWKESEPFMSDELFDKIARELSEHSQWIFNVNIQKRGEPLIDRKLSARISLLKENGIRHVNLATNGSLLNKKRGIELINSGIDEVMISIDSANKEHYERMRPGLDFHTVIDNIRTFFHLRDDLKPGLKIRIRGIAFDLSKQEKKKEIEDWERFWTELKRPGDRIYMKKPHTWGNQKEWVGHVEEYTWVYHPCIIPFSTFHINTDGKVSYCGQDYNATMVFGNVNEKSIQEIWNGQQYREIRDLHSSGERNRSPFCQKCQVFDNTFSLEENKPDGFIYN